MASLESNFQLNSELSSTVVQLMKYVGNSARPNAAGDQFNQKKVENLKKIKAQANA